MAKKAAAGGANPQRKQAAPVPPDPDLTRAKKIVTRRIFIFQIALGIAMTAFIVIASSVAGEYDSDPIGFFWPAIGAGLFGGSMGVTRRVSLPAYSQRIKMMSKSRIGTFMPVLYGGLMAGVAFIMFSSGILAGSVSASKPESAGGKTSVQSTTEDSGMFTTNLFPVFSAEADADGRVTIREWLTIRPASIPDIGKLMLWCFIAGWSERFIIGLLAGLERRAGAPADPQDDGV